jgi:DNA-binding transcriptional ArsR family regulator
MPTLDSTFAALADPTRRAILSRLALGETTILELARPFAMSQPAISRHIKVLETAGLITRRIDGTKRPCRLAQPGIDSIDAWLSTLRDALAQNYNRLDQVLADLQSNQGEPTP